MIEPNRQWGGVLISLSSVKRGLGRGVTCELRCGWQEGASHDDLHPRQKALAQQEGPGWSPSRKQGAWRGRMEATQETVRGVGAAGPGSCAVLVLGLFILRPGPHLSALGCRDWPRGLGFHGGWRGSTAEGLEGVRAREQPGFSFPCCLPSQLPSMPQSLLFCGSSFSRVTQAPDSNITTSPLDWQDVAKFPMAAHLRAASQTLCHLCNQLLPYSHCFTQNSFDFPCRRLTDLFGKTNLGSRRQGQSVGCLEDS